MASVVDDDAVERLTDLEVRVAYQDRMVAALDEVVRELAARLGRAEAELAKLRAGATPPASPLVAVAGEDE